MQNILKNKGDKTMSSYVTKKTLGDTDWFEQTKAVMFKPFGIS